ncbi:MAG: hypothetical protein RLZZ165_1919 [Bacteroidota bacterium]|jgi:hypothetical protein
MGRSAKFTIAAVGLWLGSLLSGCINEQPRPSAPDSEYTFGGKKNEVAGAIASLPNGDGFLILGGSQDEEAADYDMLLVKVNLNGEEEWSKRIGERKKDEVGWKIIRNTMGDYMILGTIRPQSGGSSLMQITDLDPSFNVRWQTISSIAVPNSGLTLHGAAFYQMADGKYFAGFAGEGSPVSMIFDESGVLVRSNAYANLGTQPAAKLFCMTRDSGFLLASMSYGSDGIQIGRIGSDGELLGTKEIINVGYGTVPLAVEQLSDGRVVFSLMNSQGHGVLLTDSALNMLSFRLRYDSPSYLRVVETLDHRIVFAGHDEDFSHHMGHSNSNYRVVVCDGLANDVSVADAGGSGAERLRDLALLSDGRVALLGETSSYGNGGTDIYLTFLNQ